MNIRKKFKNFHININASRTELAELKQFEKEQKLLQQRITEFETIIKSHTDILASWGEEKAGLLNSSRKFSKKNPLQKRCGKI